MNERLRVLNIIRSWRKRINDNKLRPRDIANDAGVNFTVFLSYLNNPESAMHASAKIIVAIEDSIQKHVNAIASKRGG